MTAPIDLDTAIDTATVDRLFRDGRTAYAFTDEPVSDGDIERIANLMAHPPTAMNTQPLRVILVRTDAAKTRLLPLLNEGNRAKSDSAPVVAILAADLDFHDELPRLVPHVPDARDRFADEAAASRPPGSTPRCRRATSSSRCALPAWTPDRWAGSTARASTASSSRTAGTVRSWW